GQVVVRAEGAVFFRHRGGAVRIEVQAQFRRDFPYRVKTQRLVGRLGGEVAAVHGDILVGHILLVVQGRCNRAIGPLADRRAGAGFGAAVGTLPAVGDVGAVDAQVALLVAGADRHAKHAVGRGVAVDAGQFRRERALGLVFLGQVIVRGIVDRLGANARMQAG